MTSPALQPEHLERAILAMDRLFAGRRDRHLQLNRESGKGFWTNPGERLTPDVWREHLEGRREIGIAPLVRSGDRSVLRCAVVDIDRDGQPGEAEKLAVKLCQHLTLALEMEPYCERTKSGQVHVWLFFADWVDGWKVRALLLHVFRFLGWKNGGGEKGRETTVYPTSDATDGNSPAGGVYCPLSGRFAAEEKQVFFDWHNGAVFSDQLDVVEGAKLIDPDLVEHHIRSLNIQPPNVHRLPGAAAPSATGKAAAETLPALSEEEFGNLCAKLPSLRHLREQPCSASYRDWFAGILHLVPFADGRARAHELSALDSARYDSRECDRQYDAAVKMYSDDQRQPEPRVSQNIVTHWRGGGRTDITPISRQYCVWNGGYAKRQYEKAEGGRPGAEKEPLRLTNFTVQIISEECAEDGVGGVERRIRLRGQLAGGQPLPEVSITAEEWSNVRVWLHRSWGMKPVIYKDDPATGGAGELLRVIALQHQDANERRVIAHTGWVRSPAGKQVFMLGSGPVAGDPQEQKAIAEVCDVGIHEKLMQYRVPADVTPEEVERAFDWIEAFLESATKRATAPLVAINFLAPLASWIRPNLALWLAGRSGTLKSSLVAAIGALWGDDWQYDHLPGSWASSAKGLLELACQAKDLPFIMDNFVPDKELRQHSKLTEVSHQLGDRASRDKLSQSSKLMTSRPVRGLVISTGEDVPSGEGASNRWYTVQMFQGDVMSNALDQVQQAGWRGEIAPAMTHYLRWLAKKLEEPQFIRNVREYFRKLESDGRQMGAAHMRLPVQTAWVKVGLALCKAAHPRGAWKNKILDREIDTAIAESVLHRNAQSSDSRLSYRFINAIQYLIATGVIHGVSKDTGNHPDREPALFGWKRHGIGEHWVKLHAHSRTAAWIVEDGLTWYIAIDPNEMVTLVKESVRNGQPITESRQGIWNNLVSDKLVDRLEKDHRGARASLPGIEGRPRVWYMHGPTYLKMLGEAPATAAPPPAAPEGESSPIIRLDQ